MDHITEENTTLLADLTDDSKGMMDKLSNLKLDNQTHTAVKVMETHLQQV